MKLRVAVLDLYEGVANQGMRCIREILNQYGDLHHLDVITDEFDVRLKNEVPGLNYDVYISSGGPGSPLDTTETAWEAAYFAWLRKVEKFNANPDNPVKKRVFFICHSFQLICRHYGLALVNKRKSTSFGVFPIHWTNAAETEPIFDGMSNPFYVVDSRDYQIVQPNHDKLNEMGATILAIEKARPHVPLERAIMAIRFNENMIGTQFHPEADAEGMLMYLKTPEKKANVIENHSEAKWESMIEQLNDPEKIMFTYAHILPNFLNLAVAKLLPETLSV